MRNIIVTSGGTSEYIDTVRKITNSGRGRLGARITDKLLEDEENYVFHIHSRGAVLPKKHPNLVLFEVTDTNGVKYVLENLLKDSDLDIDWVIHSMAVSDYTVDYVSSAEMLYNMLNDNGLSIENIKNNKNIYNTDDKISSSEEDIIIKLKKTPKLISMIKKISPATKLIGFKLLTDSDNDELLRVGRELLVKNNCDYVVANDLTNIRRGDHKALLITSDSVDELDGKDDIADKISELII